MIEFTIEIIEEDFEVSPGGELAFLQAFREALEAQALSGTNRDGQPIRGKRGRLDLHDTGELWSKVTLAPAQGGLVFAADHASVVLRKYKADGLSAKSEESLSQKLDDTLNTAVTNKPVR